MRSQTAALIAYLVWSTTASALVLVYAANLNQAKRLADRKEAAC